jgi:hypothetical protein
VSVGVVVAFSLWCQTREPCHQKRVVHEGAEHVGLSVQLGAAKCRPVTDSLRVVPRDLQSRLVDGEVLLVAAPLVVDRFSVGSAALGPTGVSVVLVAHRQRVVEPARPDDARPARRDRRAR